MTTGRASAPGAATVVNAIATLTGCAFAVDLQTEATVTLDDSGAIEGRITEDADADTRLIERCVDLTLEEAGSDADHLGASVTTESEVPMASGLKSSSAAANAAVLATVEALDADPDATAPELEPLEAALLGVRAARDVGVTITGALDDAAASMLGGVVLTDNDRDTLLHREEADWSVAILVPPERSHSADADVERSRKVASVVDRAVALAEQGAYGDALSINGLAYCAAYGVDPAPAVDVMDACDGAGLSGTGPSFAAIGDESAIAEVKDLWNQRMGTVLTPAVTNRGAHGSTTSTN